MVVAGYVYAGMSTRRTIWLLAGEAVHVYYDVVDCRLHLAVGRDVYPRFCMPLLPRAISRRLVL